ncbi:MAG: hypothetical protein AB7U05_18590 [Mangrovibacterium sp.]
MKTIRTLTMMFALTVIANMAMATGNLRVDILPLTAERAVVAISNNAESKFEISIENANGEMIYYKETEGSLTDYRKVYDFSKMEAGDYKLVVSIDGAVSEREFSVGNKAINVGKLKSVVDPVFTYNEDVLRVAYLNYPGEKVNLMIYEGSNLIYTKALENSFSVNEGLNLSKLKNGNYQVVLAAGNDVFDYTVEVK